MEFLPDKDISKSFNWIEAFKKQAVNVIPPEISRLVESRMALNIPQSIKDRLKQYRSKLGLSEKEMSKIIENPRLNIPTRPMIHRPHFTPKYTLPLGQPLPPPGLPIQAKRQPLPPPAKFTGIEQALKSRRKSLSDVNITRESLLRKVKEALAKKEPEESKEEESEELEELEEKKIEIHVIQKKAKIDKKDRGLWYHNESQPGSKKFAITTKTNIKERAAQLIKKIKPKNEEKYIEVINKHYQINKNSASQYGKVIDEKCINPIVKTYLNKNSTLFHITGDIGIINSDVPMYINHEIYEKILGEKMIGLGIIPEKSVKNKAQYKQKEKRMKANMMIDELNHIHKKDVFKKRAIVGRYLYYLVKNGYMSMDKAENFLKERNRINSIDKFPYYRSLYKRTS